MAKIKVRICFHSQLQLFVRSTNTAIILRQYLVSLNPELSVYNHELYKDFFESILMLHNIFSLG